MKRYIVFICGLLILVSAVIMWVSWFSSGENIFQAVSYTLLGIFFTLFGWKGLNDSRDSSSANESTD